MGTSGTTKYGNKASGALHSFIAGGVRPASGVVTQNYGRSSFYASGMHSGIDIASKGSKYVPIYAYKSGTVVNAGWNGDYGKCVIISHGKDANGNELQTLYAHMSKINVKVGDQVTQSTVLGRMGTTGLSTGIHLHFEIRVLNSGKMTRYNPAYYI